MHGLTTPPRHANISQASGATDEGVIRKVVRQHSQGVVGSTLHKNENAPKVCSPNVLRFIQT